MYTVISPHKSGIHIPFLYEHYGYSLKHEISPVNDEQSIISIHLPLNGSTLQIFPFTV